MPINYDNAVVSGQYLGTASRSYAYTYDKAVVSGSIAADIVTKA
jgi:hypothetical protein